MIGAVLFIWSATTLRREIASPSAAHASASLIVTFVDLAHRTAPVQARDIIRLAP